MAPELTPSDEQRAVLGHDPQRCAVMLAGPGTGKSATVVALLNGYTTLAERPNLLREALRDHDDLIGLEHDLLIVDEYLDLNPCYLCPRSSMSKVTFERRSLRTLARKSPLKPHALRGRARSNPQDRSDRRPSPTLDRDRW